MNDSITPGISVLRDLGIDPDNLQSVKPLSKRIHYRAVVNWFTKYTFTSNDSPLEKIRNYLESIHHLSKTEDWTQIEKLLIRNDIFGRTMANYLIDHSYFQETTKVLQEILSLQRISDTRLEYFCHKILLTASMHTGSPDKISSHLLRLTLLPEKLAKENPELVISFLVFQSVFGAFASSEEKMQKLIEQAEIYLLKVRDQKDNNQSKELEESLNFLEIKVNQVIGLMYQFKGWNSQKNLNDFRKANYYNKTALDLLEKLKVLNSNIEYDANLSLGHVHYNFQKYNQAIPYYEKSLILARSIGSYKLTALSLTALGDSHCSLRKYSLAIDSYKELLSLAQYSQDHWGISNALYKLINTYIAEKKYEEAEPYCHYYLNTEQENKDIKAVISIFDSYGDLLYKQKKYQESIAKYKVALTLIQDYQGENANQDLLFLMQLRASLELSAILGIGRSLIELAHQQRVQKNFEQAAQYCFEAIDILGENKERFIEAGKHSKDYNVKCLFKTAIPKCESLAWYALYKVLPHLGQADAATVCIQKQLLCFKQSLAFLDPEYWENIKIKVFQFFDF